MNQSQKIKMDFNVQCGICRNAGIALVAALFSFALLIASLRLAVGEPVSNDGITTKPVLVKRAEQLPVNPLDEQIYAVSQPIRATDPEGPLQFVPLDDTTGLGDEHVERIPSLPRIQGVWLEYDFTDRSLKALQTAKSLRSLGIKDCKMTDAAIRTLLGHLPELESFCIRPWQSPSMAPSEETMKEIGRLRHLEDLYLESVNAPHGGLTYLSELTHLRRLEVSSKQIDEQGIAAIVKLPRLESLTISGPLSDVCISQITKMPNLVHLEIDSMIKSSADAYRQMNRMICLKTFRTPRNLPDGALEHIAQLPALERLYLNNCPEITDQWMPALLKMRPLRTLDVSGTQVSPDVQKQVHDFWQRKNESIAMPIK